MNRNAARSVAIRSLTVPGQPQRLPTAEYIAFVSGLNEKDSDFFFGDDGRITCNVCNLTLEAGADPSDDGQVDLFGSFENYKSHVVLQSHKEKRDGIGSNHLGTSRNLLSILVDSDDDDDIPTPHMTSRTPHGGINSRKRGRMGIPGNFVGDTSSSDEIEIVTPSHKPKRPRTNYAPDTSTKTEESERRRRSASVISIRSTPPLEPESNQEQERAQSAITVSSTNSQDNSTFRHFPQAVKSVVTPITNSFSNLFSKGRGKVLQNLPLETPGAGPSHWPSLFIPDDDPNDGDYVPPKDEQEKELYAFPREESVNFTFDSSPNPFQTPPRLTQSDRDRIPSASEMQSFGNHQGSNARNFNLNYDEESPIRSYDRGGPGLRKEYSKFADTKNIHTLLNDKPPSYSDAKKHLRALEMMEKIEDSFTENCQLLPHQIIGLSWMLRQELEGGSNKCGGILADEMGLGKTFQTMALVVCNPAPLIKHEIDYDKPIEGQWSGPPTRRPTLIIVPASLVSQWESEFSQKLHDGTLRVGVHHLRRRIYSLSDIERYDVIITSFGTIRSDFEFRARKKKKAKKTPKKSKTHGGVPTPQLVDVDRNNQDQLGEEEAEEDYVEVPQQRKLYATYQWHRVVIDEAQNIRNRNVKLSQCVALLNAKYRWALTGTPVTNTLADLYGLLRFLRRKPFNDWPLFNREVAKLQRTDAQGAGLKAQTILSGIMLRRKKDDEIDGVRIIELPPKDVGPPIELEFAKQEREMYERVEEDFRGKIKKVLEEGRMNAKKMNLVLVMILRLRQLCNHTGLVKMKALDAMVNTMSDDPALRNAELVRASREGDAFVAAMRELVNPSATRGTVVAFDPNTQLNPCDVCRDSLYHGARVTTCEHQICADCFSIATGVTQVTPNEITCPVCGEKVPAFLRSAFDRNFEDDDLAPDQRNAASTSNPESSPLPGDAVNSEPRYNHTITSESMSKKAPSAKVKELLRQVKEWLDRDEAEKVIVYSQWTSFIDIMEGIFRTQHIRTLRFDGRMSIPERDKTLKKFSTDDAYRVMFVSLKCGGVGLNLVRANNVISMDLAWNWATEAQAIDRVHRLGQRRRVMVKRFIVKDTIEERIIRLQGSKQALADAAVGEGAQNISRLTPTDIARLFNIDPKTLELYDAVVGEEEDDEPVQIMSNSATSRQQDPFLI